MLLVLAVTVFKSLRLQILLVLVLTLAILQAVAVEVPELVWQSEHQAVLVVVEEAVLPMELILTPME
jgi:hypothetical protein